MLFSEIINPDNISEQNAFLLWMIYEWPIFLDDNTKLLAYSGFNPIAWWEDWNAMVFLRNTNQTINHYVEKHYEKLSRYLNGWWYQVERNQIIRANHRVSNHKQILHWVSVIFDFDLNIPDWITCENYLYWIIEKWLIDISDHYKNIFFTWVIDARCSLDFHHSYATIDLEKKRFPEICRRKMNKYSDIIWTICNYNPRLTQWARSSNKNDQYRINLQYFAWHFWFFTPFRIDLYEYMSNIELQTDDNFFFKDFRFLQKEININISSRNIWINNLAIQLKQQGINDERKKEIIAQYKIDNHIDDDDDEILYSSQNVKEAAKIRDNYQCEMDHNHITFNARSNGMNYVEAHHLIPFSERNRYDLSIDVVENIVCLCPNCHRKIHLAIDEQKKQLLNPLFNSKIEELNKVWINLDIETLYHYYWIE